MVGFHLTAYSAPRLPVGPVFRRQTDGSIARVLPLYRHLVPMPELDFRDGLLRISAEELRRQGGDASGLWFAHPEVLVLIARISALLEHADIIVDLTQRDVCLLKDADALIHMVIEPVSSGISALWPSSHLLPIFGNWPTFEDVQARFRERNGRREVYDAIGFLHRVGGFVDLIEQKLGARSRELIGLGGE